MQGRGVGKEFCNDPYFRVTGNHGAVLVNDNSESRQILDACVTRHKTCLNPIVDWTDKDVWEFIKSEHIPYCELYDCGWHRIGCIGCPMASKREKEKEFSMWPGYKSYYLRTFEKMIDERKKRGKINETWTSAIDVYHWWLGDGVIPGQMTLEELEDEYQE